MVHGVAADLSRSTWLLSLSGTVVLILTVRSAIERSLAELQLRRSAAFRRCAGAQPVQDTLGGLWPLPASKNSSKTECLLHASH